MTLNESLIGFVLTCFAGMGAYIAIIEKRHAKERKEWADREEKNFNRVNEIADETNKVLRENTNILSGLKTLFENRRANGR